MAVAAFVVHWGDPLFMGQGAAKEPALLYLTGTAVLLAAGPGRYSLDAVIGVRSTEQRHVDAATSVMRRPMSPRAGLQLLTTQSIRSLTRGPARRRPGSRQRTRRSVP